MAFFFFLLVLITVLVLPAVVFTVVKVVPRMIDRSLQQDRATPELESRLARIEDAIDAMAVEIERLRAGEEDAMSTARRLPGGADAAAERDA
jgi:hypothetical protein